MKDQHSGKLRIGDNWNAIRIIALSQSNPLKAVAEFVENSIDARAGAIVRIPLFDSSCGSPNSCKEGFHVVDFGCVKVIGWEQNKQLYYPPPNSTTKCMKPKLVHVAVSCDKACNTACGSTSGGGCPPGSSVCAVNLIE